MDEAIGHFDARASQYAADRRRIVPRFDDFYGAAVDALPDEPRRVLDLGAGTGLLAAHVAARYPDAELTLLDGSPQMLERAREIHLAATLVAQDLRDPLPQGPFDAIVSALAIHHLDDPAKQDLFVRIHAALAPGGVFVNAEQVLGPTPELERAYEQWHEREAKANGTSETEWEAALERMSFDRCATVEDQLNWLQTAGFARADCIWRDHRFAVFVALR